MRRTLSLAALATLLTATGASAAPLVKAAPAKAAPAARAEPAPAAAPAASGGGLALKDLEVAAWLGGEFGDLDGVYLRADAAMPLMKLAPKIDLLGVASLGFTHLGDSNSYFKVSWNMIRAFVAARGRMELTPQLDCFADAGLGFYFGGWKSEVEGIVGYDPITFSPIYGTQKFDDTAGGATMRFAVGGNYKIDQKLAVGAELGFNPYFGDADTTNFFIGVGGTMKL
jgi:hypothetical protein